MTEHISSIPSSVVLLGSTVSVSVCCFEDLSGKLVPDRNISILETLSRVEQTTSLGKLTVIGSSYPVIAIAVMQNSTRLISTRIKVNNEWNVILMLFLLTYKMNFD